MANLYPFEVHTPYRLFFRAPVEAVIFPLIDGDAGVYAGHAPFTAPVSTGIMRIKDKDGQWKSAFTTEGILEVKNHKVVLVVDAAEWPGEIDYQRALTAKQRAEEALKSGTLKFETSTAEANLKRAETRIKAYKLGTGEQHGAEPLPPEGNSGP